ncbi:MAG: hypothetical protein ACRDRE_20070 [Pseudonocardiaceae bacterium]
MGQVEDQGEVQWVCSDAQGLMQYSVAADVFEVNAAPQQVPLEVIGADGPEPQSGSGGDQNVSVGGVRPAGAALGEPGEQRQVGQLTESLGVSGEDDAPVGQVEVVECEVPDGRGAGGVDGGQGNDQPLQWCDRDLFHGADLGGGHRQQAAFDVGGLEACGGVREDQSAFLGEAEQ